MKKNIINLIIPVLLLFACAQSYGQSDQVERTFKATDSIKNQRGIIEIRNKSAQGISVTILNDDHLFLKHAIIPPAQEYVAKKWVKSEKLIPVIRVGGLNPDKQVVIKIGVVERGIANLERVLVVNSYKVYQIKPGPWKLIALSYEDNRLRVQKGSDGRTQSGISLKGNIKKFDDQSTQTPVGKKKEVIGQEEELKDQVKDELIEADQIVDEDFEIVPIKID